MSERVKNYITFQLNYPNNVEKQHGAYQAKLSINVFDMLPQNTKNSKQEHEKTVHVIQILHLQSILFFDSAAALSDELAIKLF